MHTATDDAPTALLRRAKVEQLTGLSSGALYRLVREGSFPKPLKLGVRASAWRADEIRAWIEAKTQDRDTGRDVHLRVATPRPY